MLRLPLCVRIAESTPTAVRYRSCVKPRETYKRAAMASSGRQARASATAAWPLVLLVAAVVLAHLPAVDADQKCSYSMIYDIPKGNGNHVFVMSSSFATRDYTPRYDGSASFKSSNPLDKYTVKHGHRLTYSSGYTHDEYIGSPTYYEGHQVKNKSWFANLDSDVIAFTGILSVTCNNGDGWWNGKCDFTVKYLCIDADPINGGGGGGGGGGVVIPGDGSGNLLQLTGVVFYESSGMKAWMIPAIFGGLVGAFLLLGGIAGLVAYGRSRGRNKVAVHMPLIEEGGVAVSGAPSIAEGVYYPSSQ